MKTTQQTNLIEVIVLSFGLVLVAVNHFLWPLNDLFSLVFLAITLIIFGLPHGSLDHLVEEKSVTKFNYTSFITIYLLQITVVAICWIFFPVISLVLFLILSAWHFAETEQLLSFSSAKKTTVFISILYGSGVLGWILLSNLNQTLFYLQSLAAVFNPGSALISWLTHYRIIIIFCCGLLVLLITVFSSFQQRKFMLIKTALLLLITYQLPLITAFAFYFGLWHALHALMDIKLHLKTSWKQLYLKAMPLSLISIVGLVIFLIASSQFKLNLVLLTFMFISALTLPHARVMDRMYQTKK